MSVPSNIVIPFMGVDFDSSKAVEGSAVVPTKMLIIGQRLASGAKPALETYQPTSADEAGAASGWGSMVHKQVKTALANNPTVPIDVIALDDAATATAATHAWELTGTATAAGAYIAYLGGKRFEIPVAIGDTAAALQALLVTDVSEQTNDVQFTAAASTGTLTLTSKNKGIAAGDLDVRFNAERGEVLPAGLSLSVVTHTPGTVDPDITDALAVISTTWYNVGTQPYTDNTNMNLLETFCATVAGVMEQRASVFYQAVRDTRSNMITYGSDTTNRNSQWLAVLPAYGRRQSTYELAAAVCGQTAVSIQDDPAVPLHRMPLSAISALSTADRWKDTERNQLAVNGVATLTDEVGVQTESTVTMFLKNSAGAASTAYQMQNTVFILSASRYRFTNRINTKYARAKLAASADNVKAGQQIITKKVAFNEAVAWFKELQRDGWFDPSRDALAQFKNELRVELSNNRIDWLLPPDLINQFIVGSAVIQFRQ